MSKKKFKTPAEMYQNAEEKPLSPGYMSMMQADTIAAAARDLKAGKITQAHYDMVVEFVERTKDMPL